MSEEGIALLGDETPMTELEELRALIADAQERGFVTYGEIEACLEEVEVTKEQVQDLHAFLDEAGIEVVEAEGRPAMMHAGPADASNAVPEREPAEVGSSAGRA